MTLQFPNLSSNNTGSIAITEPKAEKKMVSELNLELLEQTPADASRWTRRHQTTLQKITEVCSSSISNGDLVSVRRLNSMQLRSHRAQLHLQQRSSIANARLAGGKEPLAMWEEHKPPEDLVKHASDVVKLLSVWDKYGRSPKSRQHSASPQSLPLSPRLQMAASFQDGASSSSGPASPTAATSMWRMMGASSPAMRVESTTSSASNLSTTEVGHDELQQDPQSLLSAQRRSFKTMCSDKHIVGNVDAGYDNTPSLDSLPSIRWREREKEDEESMEEPLAVGTHLLAGPIAELQQEYAGGFASCRRLQERVREVEHFAILANPAGFDPNVAALEVAAFRNTAERGRRVVQCGQANATTETAVRKQLRGVVQELHYRRPYFSAPVTPKRFHEVERVELPDEALQNNSGGAGAGGTLRPAVSNVEARLSNVQWSVHKSVFRARRIESDAQDVYDTQEVRERLIQQDWWRATACVSARQARHETASSALHQLLVHAEPAVAEGRQHAKVLMRTVGNVLLKHCDVLLAAFAFYCLIGSGVGSAVFSMGRIEWLMLLVDCGLCDKLLTPIACNDVFSVACGVTEPLEVYFPIGSSEDGSSLGMVGSSTSTFGRLQRHQFLDALVRLAIIKYADGVKDDAGDGRVVAEALRRLLSESLSTRLPAEARHDPNSFRRTRLYTNLVAEQMEQNLLLLLACYNLQKAKARSKHLGLDGWMAFLHSVDLFGPHTGIGLREARLVFGWSQMAVVDESGRSARPLCITFIDFLEAICRLADTLSPPPLSDVRHVLRETIHEAQDQDQAGHAAALQTDWPYQVLYGKVGRSSAQLLRRPSFGLLTPKTRPLFVKVDALLNCIIGQLHQLWGTEGDVDLLVHKLTALAKAMGS